MKEFCENCGMRFDAKEEGTSCNNKLCPSLNNLNAQFVKADKGGVLQMESTSNHSPLRVVKGDLFNTLKRVTRTKDLLNFSQSIFWPDHNFSEEKELQLLLLLAEHFRDSKDIDETFRELVERTVLAKRWFEAEEYRLVPRPEIWFNIDNINGLYFTHRLHGRMLTLRNLYPRHERGISIISEAILRFCEKKNILDVSNYREKFIGMHRCDLLQYYYNAVIHIQFINL